VTVASLNLHCGFSSAGAPYDVVSAICQLGADIICLQEVWLPAAEATAGPDGGAADQVAEAARKLGASVHRAPMASWPSLAMLGLPADSGGGEISVAVLSALPVAAYRVLELGTAPADKVPRFAQVLRYTLPGGAAVDVVNTHLTHRLTSPLQLRKLQRMLRAGQPGHSRVPCVIAGDLNMPRLLAHRTGGFAAAIRTPSWPARRPVVQLDHVLAGPGVEPVDAATLPEVGSDHRPVRATLRLGVAWRAR
jgi:endonuclease/exonuclease/phosphatase family metal-dependent hydrolase